MHQNWLHASFVNPTGHCVSICPFASTARGSFESQSLMLHQVLMIILMQHGLGGERSSSPCLGQFVPVKNGHFLFNLVSNNLDLWPQARLFPSWTASLAHCCINLAFLSLPKIRWHKLAIAPNGPTCANLVSDDNSPLNCQSGSLPKPQEATLAHMGINWYICLPLLEDDASLCPIKTRYWHDALCYTVIQLSRYHR